MPILHWTFADGEVLSAAHLNSMVDAIDSNTLGLQDISSRVLNIPDLLALKELIFYKGEITVDKLTSLLQESSYSIYKLVDTQENILKFQTDYQVGFENNSFIVCVRDFSNKLTPDNFYKHWVLRTGFYEKATSTREGIVSTEYQEFSGLKTFLNGIEVKGTLNLKEGKLLITDDAGLNQIVSIPPDLNTKLKNYDEELEKLWKEVNKSPSEEDLPEHIQDIWREISDIRNDFTAKDSYLEGIVSTIQNNLMFTNISVSNLETGLDQLNNSVNEYFTHFNEELPLQIAGLEKKINDKIATVEERISSIDTTFGESLSKLNSDFYSFKEEISSSVSNNYTELSGKFTELEEQQLLTNKAVVENNNVLTENLDTLEKETTEKINSIDSRVSSSLDIVEEKFNTLNSGIDGVRTELNEYKEDNNASVSTIRTQVATNATTIKKIEDSFPVRVLSQADYNKLPIKKRTTLYFIEEYGEAKRLYIGRHLIARKIEGNNYFDYSFPIIF